METAVTTPTVSEVVIPAPLEEKIAGCLSKKKNRLSELQNDADFVRAIVRRYLVMDPEFDPEIGSLIRLTYAMAEASSILKQSIRCGRRKQKK